MQHGPRNISTSQASWRKKKSQHPAICVQDWCTRIGTSTYWRTAPAFCVTNSTTKLKLLVGWLDPLTPGSVQRRAVTSSFFRGFRKTSCDFGQIFMENDSGTFGSIRPVLEKIMESSFQCPTFYLWANSFEAVLFVLCIRTVHWFGSLRNSACMHLLSC